MITKRMLVLANSTKHYPQTCIAGRELLEGSGTPEIWGPWIRPVSNHDEGALNFGERRLANGTDPRPLDLIQIPLSAPEKNPLQPENWLLQPGDSWKKESSLAARDLLPLIAEPASLWLDPYGRSDRASPTFLQSSPIRQSLYLIRPDSLEFEVRSKTWDGLTKKQLRGVFNYRRCRYELNLTDPVVRRKYFPDFRRATEGFFAPNAPRNILLCISLTPPYEKDGLHYKVIATVFELPA
jgi:hypothetical protein